MPALQIVVHVFVALVVPPLLLGIIARVKAIYGGRRGQPLLQPYHDLWKLFQKGSVFSRTTTWVFRAGPVVGLATTLLASLFVPFGYAGAPVSFAGDLILFAYLFGLGRFFTVLAAMDTGSSFEGMGAAREATWACLAEPALFLGLLAAVRVSGEMSLSGILGEPALWARTGAPLALVVVSFFIVLLAENSRIPFDDPNTHLELTMVHEVMVLDHSGPSLGMILYGAALKLFLFGALVVRLVLPSTGIAALDWVTFLAAMFGVAVAIGVLESTIARLQLTKVPRLLVSAVLLSAFGLLLVSR
jgi:formate hydrogenlyase subunit 4